jgi:hypothetical protein
MAQEQHGHSKVALTDTELTRAGEHEGPIGEFWWRGVAQGDAGTKESRLEAVEARGTKPTTDKSGKVQRHIYPERSEPKVWVRIQSRTLY